MSTRSGEPLAAVAQPSCTTQSRRRFAIMSTQGICNAQMSETVDRLGSQLVSDRTSSLYTIRLTNPAPHSLRNGALFNPETPRTTEPDQPCKVYSAARHRLCSYAVRLTKASPLQLLGNSNQNPQGVYTAPFLSLLSPAILRKNGATAGHARDVTTEATLLAQQCEANHCRTSISYRPSPRISLDAVSPNTTRGV
jgi:hypothetical protein